VDALTTSGPTISDLTTEVRAVGGLGRVVAIDVTEQVTDEEGDEYTTTLLLTEEFIQHLVDDQIRGRRTQMRPGIWQP
jgi:hypothetical protein